MSLSRRTGSVNLATGPEIGFTVHKNLRLGLGYNSTGISPAARATTA